jgi:hypothetical protein
VNACRAQRQIPERLTKGELLKVYLAIDRELIRESYKTGNTYGGLSGPDLQRADEMLTDFMKLDYTDETINQIANTDIDNLEGLGNIFKKIGNAAKKVVNVVVQTVKPVAKAVIGVVKAAVNVVKVAVTAPVRAVVSIGLETLKGPVAKAFTYVFIPDDAPELEKNPKVKEKRAKHLKAVDGLVEKLGMDRQYVLKHIRNAIVTHYKKNPEDVLHDFANKTETELVLTEAQAEGLGELVSIVTGIVSAISALAGSVAVIKNAFDKKNIPSTQDWQQILPPARNITNDPAFTGAQPWYKKPAGIAGIGLGLLALGVGGYYVLTD